VAAADDDCVVMLRHYAETPLKCADERFRLRLKVQHSLLVWGDRVQGLRRKKRT
jgi:hypothetical protein